jgi:hypothetical protein
VPAACELRHPRRRRRRPLLRSCAVPDTQRSVIDAGPFNAEPHKCAKVAWYPLSMLPDPVMPYSALGVSLYLSGARYATLGW